MIRSTKFAILTIAIIFCLSNTHGQTTSESPALLRAKVEFLVGSFTTVTNIPPSSSMPKGATGTGNSVISWTLDSMFLSIENENVSSILGHYKGHGMLGYDLQMHQYVLSMFNNFGDHPTYHGSFVGDTLVLQTKVEMPKHPFDQKLLWYKDGDVVKLKVLNDFGKGFLPALEETGTPVSQRMK